MTVTKEWLADRAREDRRLYELWGKPLEPAHTGEYLAIGSDGQTILGSSLNEVTQKTVSAFGAGNFALARVGHPAMGRWLLLNP